MSHVSADATFCTTLKHTICWVKLNPNTVSKTYEHIVIRFLSSNVILINKYTLFSAVSHHGLTQMQRMLTADLSQEQTCNSWWKWPTQSVALLQQTLFMLVHVLLHAYYQLA